MSAMQIHFHTIALEPARWTPKRVSQKLTDLLPRIAEAEFRTIEVFEPHLREEGEWVEIRETMRGSGLDPVILSSYVDIAGLPEAELPGAVDALERTMEFFGFAKARIFPGPRIAPADAEGVARFTQRLAALAERLRGYEILLETHDGSIADDPARIVAVVKDLAAPNVGLLFQPTVFDPEATQAQFDLQRELIRHVHLQNRKLTGREFETLEAGITRWEKILPRVLPGANATLEFVPLGIVPEDKFDMAAALEQARGESRYAAKIADGR